MNSWVASRQTRERPRLRLFCLPFAGGSSMIYRGWAKQLPESVEVCPVELPGRWMRMREPLLTEVSSAVAAILDGVSPLLDMPYAIFGHSLGAILGFELARLAREKGDRTPRKLYVSARRAPHFTPIALHASFAQLDDAGLVAAMNQRYPGGFAPQVLADPELLDVVVPILRADMVMFEGYRYREQPPLDIPIAALGGQDDATTPVADLDAWRAHTSSVFSVALFEGGHFFLQGNESKLLQWLTNDLASLAADV